MFYVYQITGPTGIYVGQSRRPSTRWSAHKSAARTGETARFYNAIRKHGADSFNQEVIATAKSLDDVFECEKAVIRQLKQQGIELYNCSEGGDGPHGRKLSAETKAKIGNANRGRKMSESARAAIGAGAQKRYAALSPEQRKSLGDVHRGKKRPDQAARMRLYRHSEETLEKLRNPSAVTLEKMRLASTGRKRSEEERAASSRRKKAWWATKTHEERKQILAPTHAAARGAA